VPANVGHEKRLAEALASIEFADRARAAPVCAFTTLGFEANFGARE
jgi:hypothetical protein